jgi:hypothetical protein
MGALIFDQRVYNAHVIVTPVGLWVVQSGGGNLNYSVQVVNNESYSVSLTGWNMVTLPNGSLYGPVFGPMTLTMPAGIMVSRLRSLYVPASAPPGQYYYHSYAGTWPNHPWDHTVIPFTKLAGQDQGGNMALEEWICTESEEIPQQAVGHQLHPSSFTLQPCSPNPFNPSTVLSFELRVPSLVRLTIWDTAGRQVSTLVNGWRDAGRHEVTFDASGLAAGMYLSRLDVDGQTAVSKMVLMK